MSLLPPKLESSASQSLPWSDTISFSTCPDRTSLLSQWDRYPHQPPKVSCLSVSAHSVSLIKIRFSLGFLFPRQSTESPSASQSSSKTWPNTFTFVVFWISLNQWSLQLLIFISFSNLLIDIMYSHQFSLLWNHVTLKNTLWLLFPLEFAQYHLPTR